MSKGFPIPTRFDRAEEEAISKLQQQTGLSQAEIIRRAVRYLRLRFEKERSVGFIVEELSPEYRAARTSDESATGYRAKKKAQK